MINPGQVNAQRTFGRGEGGSNAGISIFVANANEEQLFLVGKFTMDQLESFF